MALQGPLELITGEAGGTLTAKKYYIVELENDGTWVLADTDNGTNVLHGVLQSSTSTTAPVNPIVSGDPISICTEGICKVVAGAAVEEGVAITTDASGRAVTGQTSGDYVLGCAIEPASAAGVFFKVKFKGVPSQAN